MKECEFHMNDIKHWIDKQTEKKQKDGINMDIKQDDFVKLLAASIRTVGEHLIKNSETLATSCDNISEISVFVNFAEQGKIHRSPIIHFDISSSNTNFDEKIEN